MKKFWRGVGGGGGGSGPSNNNYDDDDSTTTTTAMPLSESLAILSDHRQLHIGKPRFLPTDIVDPNAFPYYISAPAQPPPPTPSSSSQQQAAEGSTADTLFVKQTGQDAQSAIAYIRDDWIRHQMHQAEPSFTSSHAISVFISTLNCAGRKPDRQELDLLLQSAARVDLIVLGLQEMVDLNVTNAMSDSASRERTQLWLDMIQRTAMFQQEGGGYVLLGSKYLVGIMLCVFVSKPLKAHCSNVQVTSVSTGAMGGLVGNKGGCALRFELHDTSFCFVSAHLAAHMEQVEARNSDVRSISQKTSFKLAATGRGGGGVGLVPEKHHSRIASTSPVAVARGELGLEEHDYCVWLGDFNYRVDRAASAEEVLDKVAQGDWGWLAARDQLRREMAAERVFADYTEVGKVTQFAPTYKYEPGTDQYERRAEKKLRAPAWTDRVVWKHVYEANCVFYQANLQVKFSDHRAVECGLRATVRVVKDDARNATYRQVNKQLESALTTSGTAAGSFHVSSPVIDFGTAVYRQVVRQSLTLRNDHQMAVVWRLVPRPDSPTWYSTREAAYGLLLPGEETKLQFEMEVGLDTARQQQQSYSLRDVCEIRVHPAGGVVPAVVHGPSAVVATMHSFFLAVRAEWLPSCFGACSLASLLWAPLPIHQNGPGEVQYANAKLITGNSATAPLAVPKELWRLVFRLQRDIVPGGQAGDRLFLTHGDADECRAIRHCLDTGASFPQAVSVFSYASVLLELLDALHEPVIPVDYFPDELALDQPQQDAAWVAGWLSSLPAPNYNTLQLVLALVSKMLHAASASGGGGSRVLASLAPVFADVLFRPALAANVSRETATTNASGFGEFASWLGGGGAASAAGKAETTKTQAAITAFTQLVQAVM